MNEFLSNLTPEEVGSLLTTVSIKIVVIIAIAVILVAWAKAFAAKWGKR